VKDSIIAVSFIALTLGFLVSCSDDKDQADGEKSNDPGAVIRDNVNRINKEQADLNRDGKNVKTPPVDTLKTRLEKIVKFFCDAGAKKQCPARLVTGDNPERAYASDGLAMKLNGMSESLAKGYKLDIGLKQDFAKSKYGFMEAFLTAKVIADGKPLLIIEYSYETKYDKFHEMKISDP